MDEGHEVTLYAADKYKPTVNEVYPFKIEWGKCKLTKVFLPNRLPWMPGIKKFLKDNYFDMIISSEVFSISTYYAYKICKERVIAWHEIAKHQAMLCQLPSKIWYNIIAKQMMKGLHVIARSEEAKEFIRSYCRNTEEMIIDHGVNLDKFVPCPEKANYFVVCSQLIARKKIDGIIEKYKKYIDHNGREVSLLIIGDGNQRSILEEKAIKSGLKDNIQFLGKMSHKELIPVLSKARALLVNTEKDNSMISIVESIAEGTPVVTTDVPLNASYIRKYKLGIAKEWDEADLAEIVENNELYVNNCLSYRENVSTKAKVKQFVELLKHC
jgi:1,2-diacylglycerol 3-alpha-glucosyltransferase